MFISHWSLEYVTIIKKKCNFHMYKVNGLVLSGNKPLTLITITIDSIDCVTGLYEFYSLQNHSPAQVISISFFYCRGDGSCKHVTAMLFGICEMVQRVKTSPTDQPCQWTKSRVTSSSVPIRALQTSQATGITPHHTEYMPVACGLTPDEIRQRTLQLLISTDSDALMRTVLQPPTPAVRITPPPPVPDTRTSLQDLADKHVKAGGTRQTFVQCLPRYFTSELLLSCQQLQQGSPDWTSQRKGRITASSMYAVTRFTGRKPDGALVKQIINGSDISTPAMTFGHDNEDLARQLYLLGHQQQHPGVRVDQTGLHVDPDRPFLAASPDGLVHCPECGPGLLEVKCSFKYRDLEAQEAALQKGYHFEKQDKVISLRENSPWNYQIQCQLGVCRRTWCDLVLFTEKGILITKVIASPVVWQEIKEKGEYFFQKYVLPKMM